MENYICIDEDGSQTLQREDSPKDAAKVHAAVVRITADTTVRIYEDTLTTRVLLGALSMLDWSTTLRTALERWTWAQSQQEKS